MSQRPRRLVWPFALAIAAAVALTYANALNSPFVLDDQAAVVQNPDIRDLSDWRRVLWPASDAPVSGRPAANLTFALNYAAGGLDATGYRVVNIALHALCAMLLFAVARRTLTMRTVNVGAPAAAWVAFAGAVLWAVHPLNSEVVNYVSQRTESLMAACYLLTLYAAIRGWTTVAVAACALGMASKESMATAPLMVMLYDRVFVFASWRDALQRRRGLYAGLAGTWALLVVLVSGNARAQVAGFDAGVSPWTYLLNQTVIVTGYLRLVVWPRDLVAYYGWPLPLTLADVWPYALFLVALAVAACVALVRWPPVGYAAAWFFVTLAPASSVVPVATEVGAERRMYLPLAAVVVLAVGVVFVFWQRRSQRIPVLVPAVAATVLIAILAGLTWARTREYASPLELARTIVERRPTPVAHHIYAEQLMGRGRMGDAIPHLQDAVRMGNSRAGYLLGAALLDRGETDRGLRALDAFTATWGVRLWPRWLEPPIEDVASAYVLRGRTYLLRKQWTEAVRQAEWVLRQYPGHVESRRVHADAMFGQQQWPAAASSYEGYLRARPGDADAWVSYGISLVGVNDVERAVLAFQQAVTIDPKHRDAPRLLSMALDDRARMRAAGVLPNP